MRPFPAAGPWQTLPSALPPPAAPHVYCYLRMRHPLARQVLLALADCRLPGACNLHEAGAEIVAPLRRAGITVYATPPLREALGRASLLIHHGGIGSLEEAALAGRPQLLLPRHLEQSLNTQRVLSTLPGTVTVRAGITAERLRQRLPELVADAGLMRAAQMAASRPVARQEMAWSALQRLLAQIDIRA